MVTKKKEPFGGKQSEPFGSKKKSAAKKDAADSKKKSK